MKTKDIIEATGKVVRGKDITRGELFAAFVGGAAGGAGASILSALDVRPAHAATLGNGDIQADNKPEFTGKYPFVQFSGIPQSVPELSMRKHANEGGADNHENTSGIGRNFMASPGVNITHDEKDPNIKVGGSVQLITPLTQKELDEFPTLVGLREETFTTLAAGLLTFTVPGKDNNPITVMLSPQVDTGYYVVVKGLPKSGDPLKPNHLKINVIDGDTTNASATRFPIGQFIEEKHVLETAKAIQNQAENTGNCAEGCAKSVLVFLDPYNGSYEVAEGIGNQPLKIVDTNIV